MLFNSLLTLDCVAPVSEDDISIVEGGHELIPVGSVLEMGLPGLLSLFIHLLVDLGKELCQALTEASLSALEFLSRVAHYAAHFASVEVIGTELETDGSAAHFPLVKLVARVVDVTVVDGDAETGLTQLSCDFVTPGLQIVTVVSGLDDGNDNELGLSNLRRQNEALVVRMDHNHGTNAASGHTPGCLPDVLALRVLIFEHHLEHLGEVLAEMMGGSTLDATTTDWNV